MESRYLPGPEDIAGLDTEAIRKHFLMEQLMQADEIRMHYLHSDRLIAGGIMPARQSAILSTAPALKAAFFLERREAGIINVGGIGLIQADDREYRLEYQDGLYLGLGTQHLRFSSVDPASPAQFYLLSTPAHRREASCQLERKQASAVRAGANGSANNRTIYKYIFPGGIRSCQLVMGLTELEEGSVWNTMPPHTHSRRSEVYFYFDLPADQRVVHFLGEPTKTRHVLVANHDAVVSPPWSIHAGCGTARYSFIWGMAGENLDYADMDACETKQLR
jgi:4-deoxy-L-threo-5-hexosulose-uronate ketol-isomerase